MGLLAPLFLGGLLAIGLPVYLHLLRRHAATPRPFSSLLFFERRTQSSIRHRRLRYLALLSLRLALIVLLVLAFANPFINRAAATSAADNLLLIVVDNAVSMRAGSRLADAKREAASLLASRRSSSRVQVATLGSELHVLTQAAQDPATEQAAIASIEPGDARGSFAELAHAARLMAESSPTPVELHLFSDLQRAKMPSNFADAVFPANVALVLHPVADSGLPNWTVESVTAPGQVWGSPRTGKPARVQAVIAGFGTPGATRSVSLVVNGRTTATTSVQVPASGRATVEFPSLDVAYGVSRCEVRIDSADLFAAD
ncbi:MAG: BatA domain-containing protein, partial [Gemmatimonadales bacterium]